MQLYKNMVFAGTITFGLIAGFLFVSTRSIIAPLAMVLIGGMGNDWLDSATRSAAARKYSQKCPMCSAVIEENLAPRHLRYTCSSCGAQLTLSLRQWQIQTLNMALLLFTALILYALHVGLLLGVIPIAPAHLLLMFIVFMLLPQVAPRLYSLHPDVDPYNGVELRLR